MKYPKAAEVLMQIANMETELQAKRDALTKEYGRRRTKLRRLLEVIELDEGEGDDGTD